MKLPKKIAALLTVTLVTSNAANLGYVNAAEGVTSEVLKGTGRWETAIEVSKNGWSNATEAVIVNDASIADALAATPFADAKNAPILLTGKDSLNEKTKAELKRLGVKKVYIIGGVNTLTKKVEDLLKAEKLEVERIYGKTRELTALEIAKRLDKIKPISEIAVVDSTKGLPDAVSIAATAADKDMAIILSNSNEGTKESDEFIKSKDIKTSYVIGGVNSVSEEVKNKLPNAKRIYGKDRNETNAEVVKYFYTEKEINNAYIAKDGMGKEDHLIDALSVGVLAAKKDSPVIIVGNKLNEVQKDVTNSKSFKTVTQVGGKGNETAFNELKTMQGVTKYEVKTVAELNSALANADANDVIDVNGLSDNARSKSGKIEIYSKNAVKVNLNNTSGKSVVVNVKSGTLTVNGTHTSIDIKGGDLVINGKVEVINILEGGEVTVDNKGTSKPNITVAEAASVEVSGKVNTITVNGKGASVNISKDATVSKVEVSKDATGTVVENSGKVDKIESNAPNVNVQNNGNIGSVGGDYKPNVNGNTVDKPAGGGGGGGGGAISGGNGNNGTNTPIISDEQIVAEEMGKYLEEVQISNTVTKGTVITSELKILKDGESSNPEVTVKVTDVGDDNLLTLENEDVVRLTEQLEFEATDNETEVELTFSKGTYSDTLTVNVEIIKQAEKTPLEKLKKNIETLINNLKENNILTGDIEEPIGEIYTILNNGLQKEEVGLLVGHIENLITKISDIDTNNQYIKEQLPKDVKNILLSCEEVINLSGRLEGIKGELWQQIATIKVAIRLEIDKQINKIRDFIEYINDILPSDDPEINDAIQNVKDSIEILYDAENNGVTIEEITDAIESIENAIQLIINRLESNPNAREDINNKQEIINSLQGIKDILDNDLSSCIKIQEAINKIPECIENLDIYSIQSYIDIVLQEIEKLEIEDNIKNPLISSLKLLDDIIEKHIQIQAVIDKVSQAKNPLHAIKIIIKSDLIKEGTIEDIKYLIDYLDKQVEAMDENELKPVAQLGVTSIKLMAELVKNSDNIDTDSLNSVYDVIELIIDSETVDSDTLKQVKEVVGTVQELVNNIDDRGNNELIALKGMVNTQLGLIDIALDGFIIKEDRKVVKSAFDEFDKQIKLLKTEVDNIIIEINTLEDTQEELDNALLNGTEEQINDLKTKISTHEKNIAIREECILNLKVSCTKALDEFENSINIINPISVNILKGEFDYDNTIKAGRDYIGEIDSNLEGKGIIRGVVISGIGSDIEANIKGVINNIISSIETKFETTLPVGYDTLYKVLNLKELYATFNIEGVIVNAKPINGGDTISTTTDKKGNYSLKLEPGKYTLEFIKNVETSEGNFETETIEHTITVSKWKTSNIKNITMSYSKGIVIVDRSDYFVMREWKYGKYPDYDVNEYQINNDIKESFTTGYPIDIIEIDPTTSATVIFKKDGSDVDIRSNITINADEVTVINKNSGE